MIIGELQGFGVSASSLRGWKKDGRTLFGRAQILEMLYESRSGKIKYQLYVESHGLFFALHLLH